MRRRRVYIPTNVNPKNNGYTYFWPSRQYMYIYIYIYIVRTLQGLDFSYNISYIAIHHLRESRDAFLAGVHGERILYV